MRTLNPLSLLLERIGLGLRPGRSLIFLSLFNLMLLGCQSPENTPTALLSVKQETSTGTRTGTGSLTARGRSVYQTQCTACHGSDPHRPGSIGPEIYGSSKELLEARLLRGEYPAGYKPKRSTHSMAPLPHLKPDLEAIHSYLNQP